MGAVSDIITCLFASSKDPNQESLRDSFSFGNKKSQRELNLGYKVGVKVFPIKICIIGPKQPLKNEQGALL